MHVLFAVWEIDPFFKVGGLGDIARSLPGALQSRGVDIRVVVPYYKAVKLGRVKRHIAAKIMVPYAGAQARTTIIETKNPTNGTTVYLIQNKQYLDIPVLPDTFAFFDQAIITMIKTNAVNWQPDIIHGNDLHAGLLPLLVKEEKLPIKTMLTIHNLAHQGPAAIDVINKLNLSPDRCKVLEWEIKSRQINFLKEGIIHTDVLTTVSPTYAKEILTEEYGMELEEVLRGKEGRIYGILNGIVTDGLMESVKFPFARITLPNDDAQAFPNIPATPLQTQLRPTPIPLRRKDRSMEQNLSQRVDNDMTGAQKQRLPLLTWPEGKAKNKRYLQKILGLKQNPNIPLLAFIGRIDPWQKGIDPIHKMLRRFPIETIQFVLLGTGNTEWEERFLWLAKFYPHNISCTFTFDTKLAHQIYAGADALLVPSRFEPCGLVQMIAMFFGTIPIARRTGGLIDSITDSMDGFLFDDYSSEGLESAVNKAITLMQTNPTAWKYMMEQAMRRDFSWHTSAEAYISLYNKLIQNIL
jgi:starch synthase